MNLPKVFEEKMKDLLGSEYEAYTACYDEPRHYGLRVNTAKISVEDFLKIAPWPLEPVPWIHNGFYYDGDNIVGIDVDIAQAICDKLGYDLKVEDMEFDAIVNAVKSGKADFGAAGMTVTEDRKKSIDFTDPYTTAEQVIIVQK